MVPGNLQHRAGTVRPAWFATLAAMVMAIVLNAVIPPMQSPDEPAHLGRAYLLSKGQILLDSSPEGPGGYVNDGLVRFMDIFFEIGVHGKMDSTLINGVVPFLHWTDTSSHRAYTGTAYYFPAVYAPQAAALAIAEAFSISISHSYELARLAVFVTVMGLIAAAMSLVSPGPLALAVLLTPMAVFQTISSTIDAISLALCMLSISCFMVLLRPERHARDRLLFGTLCVTIFILASSRAYAAPLVLLPLVVSWKRRSKPLMAISVMVAVATIAWTLFAVATVHDERVQRALGTVGILKYYASHPAGFFQVLIATVKAKAGFYTASFIGQLGYLNVALPRTYHTVAACTLVLLALLSLKPRAAYAGEGLGRLVLALLAAPACLIIFVAMLATWTPFPSPLIEGVQGRYFNIPALMLAYALAGTQPWRDKGTSVITAVMLAIFVMMSASVTLPALLDRYWAQDQVRGAPDGGMRNEPTALTLQSLSVLSGSRRSEAGGDLYSVAFNLGTFFGRSNGELSIEVCAAECRRAILDVSKAADNRFAYARLDRPLPVAAGSYIQYRLMMSPAASHPLVIWARPLHRSADEFRLNGRGIDVEPEMMLAIR